MNLKKTKIHLKQVSNQRGTKDHKIKTESGLEFNNFRLV